MMAWGVVAAQGTPVHGGTRTIAYTSTSPHIGIQATNQGSLSESVHYVYETLFDRNADGELVGLLATGFEVSDDGLTYTFTLQPGVTFHDGTPFDAEAVKYNLERKIELQLPTWNSIPWDSIEVVDPLTVRVHLTDPAPHIVPVLSAKTWSMYSPTWAREVGPDGVKSNAVGTGAFMVEEFLPNDTLRLVKNPNYWQEGLPYLDAVVFRVITDPNTRSALLESGEVDLALGLPVPVTERLKSDSRFTIRSALGMRQYYITLNNFKAPTDDVLVRRAINHAVDKEGIIRAVFLGVGAEVAETPYMSPQVNGFSPGGVWDYDPEGAEALLEEAGWTMGPDGVRVKDGERLVVSLYTRRGSVTGDYEIAELVQGMLADVGVEVDLQVFESASFVPAVTVPKEESTYNMADLTFEVVTGDAEYVVSTTYRTDSAAPALYNRAYYGNPEVDALSDLSRQAATLEERNAIYAQIIPIVFQDAPILQLFNSVEFLAASSAVEGIYFEPAFSNWPGKYAWKNP
ncbi:MAG: ABC transporter substrate-binding protein [Trueperaceae bacterium]|nr:ABC transporter substrate-binding protein [Trueperaceae bacterium]